MVAEYDEGAVATLSFSWDIPSALRGVRLSRTYGTEGSAAFESNGLFVMLWGRTTSLRWPGVRDLPGYRAMFRDFFRALRTGGESLLTLDHARRDVELVEAIYRSSAR